MYNYQYASENAFTNINTFTKTNDIMSVFCQRGHKSSFNNIKINTPSSNPSVSMFVVGKW